MMKLDMLWMSNQNWYEIVERDGGSLYDKLKDDAPPEAKKVMNII